MRQLTALLWKEWRQQRAVFVALAIGCVVWVGTVWAFEAMQSRPPGIMGVAAPLFLVFCAAMLGAVSFAGERRLGTLPFLLESPVARWQVFVSKLVGSTVGWLVLGLLAFGLAACCGAPLPLDRQLALVGVAWVLFSSTLLLSAGLARPILAMVLGVGLAAGLGAAFVWFMPYRRVLWFWAEGAIVLGGVASVWLVAWAWFVFHHVREQSGRRSIAALSLAAGCTVAALVGPHLLAVVATYSLPVPGAVAAISEMALSPDGSRLSFVAWEGDPDVDLIGRAHVLDMKSGRAQPVMRYAHTRLWQGGWCGWSPGSRYLVFHVDAGWLDVLLLRRCNTGTWLRSPGGATWFYDAHTGRVYCPDQPASPWFAFLGWGREGEAFFRDSGMITHRYTMGERAVGPAGLPDGCGIPPCLSAGSASCIAARRFNGLEKGPLVLYDGRRGRWIEQPLDAHLVVLAVRPDLRYALVFRPDVYPSLDRGALVLIDLTTNSRTALGMESWYRLCYSGAGFPPKGRWLIWPSPVGDKVAFGLLKLDESSEAPRRPAPTRRMIFAPDSIHGWHPSFSADETKIVWLCTAPCDPRDPPQEGLAPRFVVQDIASGTLRALPVARRDTDGLRARGAGQWDGAAIAPDGLIFVRNGAAIYRIGLDGTGLEQIFPERRTLSEGAPK